MHLLVSVFGNVHPATLFVRSRFSSQVEEIAKSMEYPDRPKEIAE